MNADQQTFADHRNLLFSVAYRILGSAADAEDVVQDAWFKWSADDRSQVSDPKAYLARIVSNLSMERLRSTRHQRETYVGPWLPEPILTQPTPPTTSPPPNRCRWRCWWCWRRSARWSARCSCSRRCSTSATPRSVRPSNGPRPRCVRPRTGPANTSRPGGRDSRPTASRSAKPPSGSSPPPWVVTSMS